jgi:RNAse (barnase) inhibitor barstar
MKIISLDASAWETGLDFYAAILPELGAPDGHGKNLNAIVESMIWGEINKLKPPYKVEIFNTEGRPQDVLDEIRAIADFFAESRAEFRERKGRDAQVSFTIVS